jgi:hypothetical protein
MFNWLPGTEVTAPAASVDGVGKKAYDLDQIRPWQ